MEYKWMMVMWLSIPVALMAQVPHIKGTVTVSVKTGTLDASMSISNLPKINNYSIWLNTGLNIEYFRDETDQFNYDYNNQYLQELSYEAMQYYFPSSDNKGRYLPEAFNIKYTGKFPVIAQTDRVGDWSDWKGNMAFNGKTFRASEQSVWYPVLYDVDNDIVIDKYTYELTVNCVDCQSIYVNGSQPQIGSSGVFKSELPVALLLFTGDYSFVKYEDIYLLNTNLSVPKQKTLSNASSSIIEYYENALHIPFGNAVTYLSSTPVSKKNEWMFVTYPTVAVVGIDAYKLENYFDDITFEFKNQAIITFLAHELAHYYFGTLFMPNSTLKWFFLESVSDYMSIKAAQNLQGNEVYNKIVDNYIENIKDFDPIALDKVAKPADIGETYRYKYLPLLLIAIEREIGEEKMFAWLSSLIQSKSEITDYAFFKETMLTAGISTKTISSIELKYVVSPHAKVNIVKALK